MNQTYQSLASDYIQDFIHLTHEVYPSFVNRIDVTYFSLNLPASNWDPTFKDFYKTITSTEHGGRYDVYFNIPVSLTTSNTIAENASEKGITVSESTNITCQIDPYVDLIPKDGDVLMFRMGLKNDILYRVVTLEMSSTLSSPYYKLTLQAVPNLSKERMFNFVIGYFGFVPEYHSTFGKESALAIIKLQNLIKTYIEYFNSIYNPRQDGHVDNEHTVYLEFERAFNDLITDNQIHLGTVRVDRSYLHENLLLYYSDDNPFKRMLTDGSGSYDGYQCTTNIKRLEKTRRRSLNNRIKIYRLAITEKDLANEGIAKHELTLPSKAINDWKTITEDGDFIKDVKDQMTRFLDKTCKVDPSSMFTNAIRLAQLFYILDSITKSKLTNRATNLSRQLNSI